MEKLSSKKRMVIVRLYLDGLSYDEIAAKAGVSKGTVANVILDLKAGRFPEAGDMSEQIELLRELAVDMRKSGLTPGRAAVGVAALSRLQELGLEPAEIERFAAVCHTLTTETDVQAFVKAALALEEVRQHTGLSVDDLEKKALELTHEVEHLEPLAQQVQEHHRQLEDLSNQRQRLVDEVSELERRQESLVPSVKDKEKRETELSHRVQEMEERAQSADERLATARKDLQTLSGLGLALDDLSGFAQRLRGVAQRHGIEPATIRKRLLHELEQLGEGLGLETLVKTRQQELAKAQQALAKAQERLAALETATQQIRQEQATLRALLAEQRKQIKKETQAIILLARDTVTQFKKHLGDGVEEAVAQVHGLSNQALELGKELGHYEAAVQANQWLRQLLELVKGDNSITSGQVRAIGLVVLRGMSAWLNRHSNDTGPSPLLVDKIKATIEVLERWTP